MDTPSRFSDPHFPIAGWSTRLLILALMGILFLTLYPFRLTFHADLPANSSPFLLGGWDKGAGGFDNFLNVLLFVPFGFAIAEKLRERGKSWTVTLIWALTSGALLSYGIEFLQLYIPTRSSGWEDVVTNTAGSIMGFVLFDACGETILQMLSAGERALEKLLQWPRANVAIPVYFALWLAVSVPLQMQTRLSNWNPDSLLVVGNDIPTEPSTAWSGQLFRLQIWDRALPADLPPKLATGEPPGDTPGLLADYDFSGHAQLADRRKFLPDLSWKSAMPSHGDPPYLTLDGKSWLLSKEPVANLVASLQRTNQFTVRVVCKPAVIEGSDGHIVGVWERSGPLELSIRQEDTNLIFFFRNPLSAPGSDLELNVQGIFEPDQIRDILFSYDGSSATLYLDGKRVNRAYHLGPGTALRRPFRDVSSDELDAYNDTYYFLAFFTGGILIGVCVRGMIRQRNLATLSFAGLGLSILPALLLELVLVSVSGRAFSFAYPILSVLLAMGGSLWINAEGLFDRL